MENWNPNEICAQMTRKEKVAFCEGGDGWHTMALPRLGIPAVMMADGPHGLRKQEDGDDMVGINDSVTATCFPTAVTTGCSWDRELLRRIGQALGREARANGVSLVLGPGLNIKRDPLCGRNFEYFSEDPLLAGTMAGAFVQGVQSTGVGACLKHFAANSQEYKRFSSDSVLDDRTLREIYLAGFETAVKLGKPWSVMASYNKINGVYSSDNRWLLTELLRQEWGFDGFVVTDWGGMNDRVQAFRAGCDLNMPGGSKYQQKRCLKEMKEGTLQEADVDRSVRTILDYVQKAVRLEQTPYDAAAHHQLVRQAAVQSAVLLKNEGVLPIRGSACLIGHMAKTLRYQGAGSSHINPPQVDNPCDCLDWPYAPGCDAEGGTNEGLLQEAAELAKAVQTPVVVVGLPELYESEGFDRSHMRMPDGHLRLIDAVANANENTVVVLLCGSPVETPWLEKIKGLLYLALPGQAGGAAMADLLTGRENPSGRLTETWPLRYEDAATCDCFGLRDAEYREGVFVGYRYYDSAKKPVRFPFGYGLSYTSFAYENLQIEGDRVRVTVRNTGDIAGREVVQLYVCPPQGGVARPVRELKGFQKVLLQPGEAKLVEFTLDDRCFALWQEGWKVQTGEYGIQVGGLTTWVHREGEELTAPAWQAGSWYENLEGPPSREDWERLLGRKFVSVPPKQGEFTMNCTILDMIPYSRTMRLAYRVLRSIVAKGFPKGTDESDVAFKMVLTTGADCALRGAGINGRLPDRLMEGLLHFANGKPFRGIWKMLTGA